MFAAAHTASPPSSDALNRFDRHFAHRHAEQREGHERRAAHRIDVGYRVRCSDAPEIVRISTIGMKKSVVATIACVSLMRYTAASSHDSLPTRSFGKSARCGRFRQDFASNAGVSLQPQPPPCDSCVSLIAAVSSGLFMCGISVHRGNYRKLRRCVNTFTRSLRLAPVCTRNATQAKNAAMRLRVTKPDAQQLRLT